MATVGLASCAPRSPVGKLAITNVTVIDVDGGASRAAATVVIGGGRILGIEPTRGRAAPRVEQTIDGSGKFLIPALWDMHVHILDADRTLPLFVANGVLGVRDLGVPNIDELLRWRGEVAAGKIVGPRILTAGRVLDGAPPANPPYSIVVETADQARAAVDDLQARGVDCLKVYDMLSREAYFAIAEEAHRRGLPMVGHTPTAISTIEAADAGQTSIEHLGKILEDSSAAPAVIRAARERPIPEGDFFAFTTRMGAVYDAIGATYSERRAEEVFARLRRNGTWQVPTLTVKFGRAHIDTLAARGDPRTRYVDASQLDYWQPSVGFFSRYRTPEYIAAQGKYFQREMDLVGALQRAGVGILAGTDTPNAYVIAGFSLHDELGHLVHAGLTPLEALQAATRNPAMYLGELERHGTIEAGKEANLILLAADPLADIAHTTHIEAVIQNGRYLSRAQLDEVLAGVEAIAGRH